MWVKAEWAAKSEAYASSSSSSSSPSFAFDIIDLDGAVCSWLLALLHDSRLRTCLSRYDKQHDVSDACNVAGIMHVSLIRHETSGAFSNYVAGTIAGESGAAKGASIGQRRCIPVTHPHRYAARACCELICVKLPRANAASGLDV